MKTPIIRTLLVLIVIASFLVFPCYALADSSQPCQNCTCCQCSQNPTCSQPAVCPPAQSSPPATCNISIIKHPGGSSTYTNDGSPYSSTWFLVKATGVASYYWQIKYPGTDTWYDIPEPDTTIEMTDGIIASIKLHLRTHQDIVNHVGCYYRCVLIDACGTEITTNSATIYDNPPVYTPEPSVGPPCPPPCAPCVPCVPACPIIITPTCPYVPPTTVVTTTTTTTTTIS